jgi:hypothetical protein
MNRKVAVLVVLLLSFGGLASAQELQIEDEAYRVRIVNQLGTAVRVKIIGFRRDAHFTADLPKGYAVSQNLYSGSRVVCVWDREERLLMAARVRVASNGTLRLRPIFWGAAAAPGEAAPAARAERRGEDEVLPLIELE